MARDEIVQGGQRIRMPRVSPTAFSNSNPLTALNGLGAVQPKIGVPAPTTEGLLSSLVAQLSAFQVTQVLKKTMVPRKITITTTPTRIILSRSIKGYVIINPESILTGGSIQSGALVAQRTVSTTDASDYGSTESTAPVAVSNYRDVHLWLDIIGSSALLLDFYLRTQDPLSGNWGTAMLIFPNSEHGTVIGTFYKHVDKTGIAENIAIEWQNAGGGAGSVTFRVGYLFKDPLPGTAEGLSRTVYLGGNNGVTVNAGFPLLEGQSWNIILEPGAELWGVANDTVDMNIFELQ